MDYKNCTFCTYIWGVKLVYIIDCVVLGKSLHDAHTRCKTVIYVNEDTRTIKKHELLQKYWDIMPVTHMQVPDHLRGTEMERLKFVYSKFVYRQARRQASRE